MWRKSNAFSPPTARSQRELRRSLSAQRKAVRRLLHLWPDRWTGLQPFGELFILFARTRFFPVGFEGNVSLLEIRAFFLPGGGNEMEGTCLFLYSSLRRSRRVPHRPCCKFSTPLWPELLGNHTSIAFSCLARFLEGGSLCNQLTNSALI